MQPFQRHRPPRRSRSRVLQFESLEIRLTLSADAISNSGALAAIAAMRTDAPSDVAVSLIDPIATPQQSPDLPETALVEAAQLIGLTDFRVDPRFAGFDGAGSSIVVVDTGVDLDHPFFGPDADQDGVADRIVYHASFVGGSTDGDDDNGHGTHVASIIASQDGVYRGIAPGVNVIALKVLDSQGFGTAAGVESALQWAASHVEQYNIVGVNMSLSFGTNDAVPSTRPELGLSDELAALAAQDVIVSSASGNSYFSFNSAAGVAYPSSDPSSLSVGAVWDADIGGPINWSSGATDFTTGPDRIASFSQRHPSLTTIMAPGAAITAAAIGGGTATLSGTSMATPMVAGVVALAQQLAVDLTGSRLSLAEFRQFVSTTGLPIFDGDDEDDNVSNTHEWYHRLDVGALANAIWSSGLPDLIVTANSSLAVPDVPSGGTARLDWMITNQGPTSSGEFRTAVYLSSDAELDGSDILLVDIPETLAAGQGKLERRLAAPIPSDTTPGSYFLIVSLDDQSEVAEGDELNNLAFVPLEVTGDGGKILLVDQSLGVVLNSASSQLDFGRPIQGAPDVSRTLTFVNDGNVDLVLSPLSLPVGYAVDDFPQVVAPEASATFTIRLLSNSTPGSYDGTASFTSNDPTQSPFEISLIGSVLEPDDHGNDSSTATSVVAGSFVSGEILRFGDVDWFRFQAIGGQHYHFDVELLSLLSSDLKLFDVDGLAQLESSHGSTSTSPPLIHWTAPSSGYYFLEIAPSGSLEGTYRLSLAVDDDHGDAAASATPTTDPSLNNGVLASYGDRDWFSFHASAGIGYDFRVSAGSLPGAVIRLYDRDGVTELLANGGGPTSGASLFWTPTTSGTYFVEIEADAPGTLGAYQFSLTADDEFGDDAANAFLLSLPAVISGVIDDAADLDWLAFNAVAGGHYQFQMSVDTAPLVAMRLVAPNGVQQLAADVAKPGSPASLSWTAPTAGRYYIEASGVLGSSGAYQLSVDVADDYGNDAVTAAATSDPSVNAGLIEIPTDRDWFAWHAVSGVSYNLTALLESLTAAQLRLIDSDGTTELAQSASPGNPAINWTAGASGTYFVEVAPLEDATPGGYELEITGIDDYGDGPENAHRLTIPQPAAGAVEELDDADWFVVHVEAGVEYRVEASLGTLPGAQLRLFAPDQTTEIGSVVVDRRAAGGINWTPLVAGDYYIELVEVAFTSSSGSQYAGGDYEVKVSSVSAIPGDFNGDLAVDGADFLIWQRQQGTAGPATTATLDANGFEPYDELPLAGQFSWRQLGSPNGTAVVQSDEVATGDQAVRIDRATNAENWWGVHLGAQAPVGEFVFATWDMRVAATGAQNGGVGPFMGVQAYDDAGGFGLLGALGVDATTMKLVYQRQGDGALVNAGRTLSPEVWYSFGILFDFTRSEFTVYFEDQPLLTNEFVDLHVPGANLDRLTDADFIALAAQNDSASLAMTGTAFVDNFRIFQATSANPFPADANQDGLIDGVDRDVWSQHFGIHYGAAAAVAPLSAALVTGTAELDSAPSGFHPAALDQVWDGAAAPGTLPWSLLSERAADSATLFAERSPLMPRVVPIAHAKPGGSAAFAIDEALATNVWRDSPRENADSTSRQQEDASLDPALFAAGRPDWKGIAAAFGSGRIVPRGIR